MADLIRLLPDAIANQIAAGEVIQRPASVVKELLENAIDAGATEITLNVKDAGKTLIQVIDNGCGMSETDARMSFERHATSKIKKADDLFALYTMGFRGEALASIASIAQVELKTRKSDEELATHLIIEGSEVKLQEKTAAPAGSNFGIKNLFFNVPARRKFLKSDTTEFNYILLEFKKVAIAFSAITFKLFHNKKNVFSLPAANLPKRLNHLFHAKIMDHSLPVETNTTVIKIKGFAGNPEFATKTRGQQYFFVNNRYFKHNLFYRAVMNAYEGIIAPDTVPSFFLFFTIAPEQIDVNIHPTKTEIKFENEGGIMKMLTTAVKQALGKFNAVPSIDFDAPFSLPLVDKGKAPHEPKIAVNLEYNPFKNEQGKPVEKGWEQLFLKRENHNAGEDISDTNGLQVAETSRRYFLYKGKYILASARSGLMMIHYRRAQERILFESLMQQIKAEKPVSQNLLFPLAIPFHENNELMQDDLVRMMTPFGFAVRTGKNELIIDAVPPQITENGVEKILSELIEQLKGNIPENENAFYQMIAAHLSWQSARYPDENIASEELQKMVNGLFASEYHNYTPGGKKIITILNDEAINKLFE
ncbi:MAG: DNA mismatch repair endonuclease MutL [Bacteroidales bacterium]|nr:DNA mismatch repair endonuclease MutL [Bacteroidales bacterium]